MAEAAEAPPAKSGNGDLFLRLQEAVAASEALTRQPVPIAPRQPVPRAGRGLL